MQSSGFEVQQESVFPTEIIDAELYSLPEQDDGREISETTICEELKSNDDDNSFELLDITRNEQMEDDGIYLIKWADVMEARESEV